MQRAVTSMHCQTIFPYRMSSQSFFSPPCQEQRHRAASRCDHCPTAGARGARSRPDVRIFLSDCCLTIISGSAAPRRSPCIAASVHQTVREDRFRRETCCQSFRRTSRSGPLLVRSKRNRSGFSKTSISIDSRPSRDRNENLTSSQNGTSFAPRFNPFQYALNATEIWFKFVGKRIAVNVSFIDQPFFERVGGSLSATLST